MNTTLIKALKKRYATKQFDASKKISEKDLQTIIEAVRLTPTSYGLQLMKLVVVKDATLRQTLLKYSYNQNQVVDASHLLVLCNEKEFNLKHIDDYIKTIAETRNLDIEGKQLQGFKKTLQNFKNSQTKESIYNWMKNQQYIALGNLLTSCALLGIDACPMEGFIPEKYDEILELDKENLQAVLVIPIGYASDKDKNKTLKKVRRSTNEFVVYK
ncbi:MAG TPA: NAD(P)H-dependent oxidoreductase [Crocinitomix sp.]|nr:NAD(P)H-dependent oxidoreductase [Crocinitomix sp.]